MRILCVDDDPSILVVLDATLSTIGEYDVESAQSGSTALSDYIYESTQFDCMLFDIQMPGMSGIELCSKVREQRQYDHVPIIMLTAMEDQDYIDAAFEVGATDYVTKPFDPVDLITRIKTTVARFGGHVATDQEVVVESPEEREVVSGTQELEIHVSHKFELDHPHNLQNHKYVLAHRTFENYLNTMSSAGKKEISVFAIGIRNISTIYYDVSDYVFESILRDTAYVISRLLGKKRSMISYFGNGIFCVSIRDYSGGFIRDLPLQFMNIVAEENDSGSFLSKRGVKLVVGSISKPSVFRGPLARAAKVVEELAKQLESAKSSF